MNFHSLRFITLFLFAVALHATVVAQEPFSLSNAHKNPKTEIRAVWITVLNGLDWPRTKATSPATRQKQQQEICAQLDAFQAANFNTILMQTRVRGSLIYPSKYEPFCEELTGKAGADPGYDPLAFVIEECHKRGMEFHAWIVAIPMGADQKMREQGRSKTLRKQGDLFILNKYGWYLNPGHPKAKYYLADIVKEIVTHYDVDGISFDYIRYPEKKVRFNDATTFAKYGKGQPLADWRRNNLTEMVRYIYNEVKAIKPYVKVSSSPLGKYRDTNRYPSGGWNAYNAVYQEAQRWLNEGIHDAVYPMLYYRDANFYPFVVDWQEQRNTRWNVLGLAIYNIEELHWNPYEIDRQVYFGRSTAAAGQAYFRARFLMDNCGGTMQRLQQQAYRCPALIPPMTWADSIPPTTPTQLEVVQKGDDYQLLWQPSSDNNSRSITDSGIRYNVYAAQELPIDICNPQHLVATMLRETAFVITAERYAMGLHYAVTAVDVFGNESAAGVIDELQHPLPPAFITLALPEIANATTVTLFDAWGRAVRRVDYGRIITFESVERGAYTLKVTNKEGTLLYKSLHLL